MGKENTKVMIFGDFHDGSKGKHAVSAIETRIKLMSASYVRTSIGFEFDDEICGAFNALSLFDYTGFRAFAVETAGKKEYERHLFELLCMLDRFRAIGVCTHGIDNASSFITTYGIAPFKAFRESPSFDTWLEGCVNTLKDDAICDAEREKEMAKKICELADSDEKRHLIAVIVGNAHVIPLHDKLRVMGYATEMDDSAQGSFVEEMRALFQAARDNALSEAGMLKAIKRLVPESIQDAQTLKDAKGVFENHIRENGIESLLSMLGMQGA